jgi:hypothetical protein
MTILDTREVPQTAPQTDGSDLEHEVCCLDDETMMCGLIITEGEVGHLEPTCVVCVQLADRRDYYADLFGEDPQQPGAAPCRVCPKRKRGEST